MPIRLQFDRIPPGTEIGPHRHGVETLVYVAGGEIVFEHGPELGRRSVIRAGDVLYEAPAEYHLVRNEASMDALALLAAVEVAPQRPGDVLRTWIAEGEPVRRREGARVVAADVATAAQLEAALAAGVHAAFGPAVSPGLSR